jgi:glycosyltransferase involved in cell wall biosynthesis
MANGPTVAMLSFRLGGRDGISTVSKALEEALRTLGYDTVRIAGEGHVDRLVAGLSAADAPFGPDPAELAAALDDVDVVVVENLLTIPLHLPASRVVADVLRDRAVVVRHFDPPWQRDRFRHIHDLPVDAAGWVHVAATAGTQHELRVHGITSTLMYPIFAEPAYGDRAAARRSLGIADDATVCLHPVRAIERKNVPAALRLAEGLRATYVLTGPAEEDYADTLDSILATSATDVVRMPIDDARLDDVYAAADLVLFPSLLEGFGLPPIEAALRHRPVAVGTYEVARELRFLGFDWPQTLDPVAWRHMLDDPDRMLAMTSRNRAVADRYFHRTAQMDEWALLLAGLGAAPHSGGVRSVGRR